MQFDPDESVRPSSHPVMKRYWGAGRQPSGLWGIPFDRKLYQRTKARERRAKRKAQRLKEGKTE